MNHAFGKKRYFLPLGMTPKTGVGFIAKKITEVCQIKMASMASLHFSIPTLHFYMVMFDVKRNWESEFWRGSRGRQKLLGL